MLAGLLGLVGGGLAGVHAYRGNAKEAKAIASDVAWDYLAVDGNNFEIVGGGNISDWVSGRSATFWDTRSFNALDNFYDGFHNEGWTGSINSATWIQKVGHPYVTFTLGGSASNKVEILKASNNEVVKTIQNNYFNDPKLSLNMIVRVVDLTNYEGERLYLRITDSTTSGFGAVTFGALKVSQTADDVARTISVHKNTLSRRNPDRDDAHKDSVARTYTIDTYDDSSNDEYNSFVSRVLTDADMDFEDYDQLTNLAINTDSVKGFADRGDGYDSIDWGYGGAYNLADTFDWNERMPFNKQGNAFFNGNYGGDGARYTLQTNEFKLSGTGYISIKLGGRGSKVALVDASNGSELVSTTNTKFADNGLGDTPIFVSGTRLNTMTRYILDAREHLNKTVRVEISDTSTEAWSLLFFDELKTNYATLPEFGFDRTVQPHVSAGTFYGAIEDVYVGGDSTDFGKACGFLADFYRIMRNPSNKNSWCGVSQSTDVQNLLTAYGELTSEVKAIVDNAKDYVHIKDGVEYRGDDFYKFDIDQTKYTVANTMTYLSSYVPPANPEPNASGFRTVNMNSQEVAATLIITISVIAVSVLCAFMFIRKRKEQK